VKEKGEIMKKYIKRLILGVFFTGLLVWCGSGASSQQTTQKTDGSQFGKYIISTELYKKIAHYTGTSLVAHNGELQADVSLGYHCIAKPISFDKPHSHSHQEILCFIGGNPLDITDFSAEVEYTIGSEKHIIKQPACVSMPPGQQHCPISIKNVSVEKPIVFMEISLSRTYGEPGAKKEPPAKTQ
jgi:hypothetical protein